MGRVGLVAGIAAVVCFRPLADGQPDLIPAGPRLAVPSAEAHLFFRQQPVVVEGKVLVPLSAIERWLHTTVEGNRRAEFRLVYYGGTPYPVSLTMWVGQKRAVVARAEVPLDVAPQVIGGETFVPLRFVAEAIGIWVEPVGRTIRLRKPDKGWVCYLAIPPHPKSLEGKMVTTALARYPHLSTRVEIIELSPDTRSGVVSLAILGERGFGVRRVSVRCVRDRTGWHFASTGPALPLPALPNE